MPDEGQAGVGSGGGQAARLGAAAMPLSEQRREGGAPRVAAEAAREVIAREQRPLDHRAFAQPAHLAQVAPPPAARHGVDALAVGRRRLVQRPGLLGLAGGRELRRGVPTCALWPAEAELRKRHVHDAGVQAEVRVRAEHVRRRALRRGAGRGTSDVWVRLARAPHERQPGGLDARRQLVEHQRRLGHQVERRRAAPVEEGRLEPLPPVRALLLARRQGGGLEAGGTAVQVDRWRQAGPHERGQRVIDRKAKLLVRREANGRRRLALGQQQVPGESITVDVDFSAATQLTQVGVLRAVLLEPGGQAGDAHV